MTDSIQTIFCCPDCRGDLPKGAEGWKCNSCAFASDNRDLRPSRAHQVSVDFVADHSVSYSDLLNEISTAAPEISYSGPLGDRDSRQFMSVLQNLLKSPGQVLDLGCGPRDQARPIEYLGHKYVGVDYSSNKADFLVDAHRLPFASDQFDCVFSYAVLEHLYNPYIAIKEVERILRPDGLYIGTVSQGEPFHDSFFHHTSWGFLSVLASTSELTPIAIWDASDTLESLSKMGRYSRVIKSALGVLNVINRRLPFLTPRKMTWPLKQRQIDAIHSAGSIAFVVKKNG